MIRTEKAFVLEAVMLAIYGELLHPAQPVEFLIPSSTIYELEDFLHTQSPIVFDPEEEKNVRSVIADMIQYFQDPFKRKKMERSLLAPWSTLSFPYDEKVTFTIVHAEDNETWGEVFDPIETEMLLTAIKFDVPLITDQAEWQEKILDNMVPVQFFDIEDFEFAVEQGMSLEHLDED